MFFGRILLPIFISFVYNGPNAHYCVELKFKKWVLGTRNENQFPVTLAVLLGSFSCPGFDLLQNFLHDLSCLFLGFHDAGIEFLLNWLRLLIRWLLANFRFFISKREKNLNHLVCGCIFGCNMARRGKDERLRIFLQGTSYEAPFD